jgi:hypothetical protein
MPRNSLQRCSEIIRRAMVNGLVEFGVGGTMFSARWAHRTLVGICALVVIGVIAYGGWEGWLGRPFQDWIKAFLDPLASRLPNVEMLDRVARVLGAAGTALTAAYGVYKGIYYADHNLPERLKQLLRRTDERLLQDRGPLLNAVTRPSAGARARSSVFYVYPLNRALAEMGLPNLEAADRSLKVALLEIQKQIEVSQSQKHNMEEQKVAAHILRGSIASARGNTGSGTSDSDHQLAEDEFSQALMLRPNDLDALELRGRQRQLRRNYSGAREDYEALSKAAFEEGILLRAARAYRLQGELLESSAGTRRELDEARRRFDAGLKLIDAAGSLKRNDLFEKALLLEAYGRIQKQRDRLPNARIHLGKALVCFEAISTFEARSHADEVRQMLDDLTLPGKSDDSPPTEGKAGLWRRLVNWLWGQSD